MMKRSTLIVAALAVLTLLAPQTGQSQVDGQVFVYATEDAVFLRYVEMQGGLPDGYHVYRRPVGGTWTRLTTQSITPIFAADNLRQVAGMRAEILISMLGGDANTRQLRREDFDRVLTNPESRSLFMALTLAIPGLGEALGQVYIDRDLTPGQQYEYRITALRQGAELDVAVSTAIAHGNRTVLPIPTGLNGEAGDSEAFLDWDRDEARELSLGIVGYNLYRATGDVAQPYLRVNSTPVMNMRLEGDPSDDAPARFRDAELVNGTTYWYRLNAVNVFGFESDPTEPIPIRPRDMTPPASVRGLSVRQTPGAVLLTWSANEDADLRGYQVFRSAGDAQTFAQLAPTGESSMSQTSYADGDIRPGTVYWYRVRAVDRSGNVGAFSDAVEAFVEDLIPPPKVLNLRGDIRSDNAIRLRWSPVDDPSFAGYMLERSLTPEDSASFWFRLADMLRDTVFIDTLWDYQEGKVSYRVRAYDYSDNRGPWSDVATLRPPDDVPPSPPLLLELRVVEDGIEIQWELVGVADLAGYHVWRSQEKAGNYTRITQQMLPDTITLYREKPPAYGKVYWYRVSALDRDGNESAPGNPLGSVYIDRAPPPAPENLTAESLREGVRLSWTPPKSPDLEGYNIYRNDGDDGPMQLLDQLPRAGNAFTDRTAELGKTYIYEVAAYDRKYNIGPRAGPLTVTFEVEQDDRK